MEKMESDTNLCTVDLFSGCGGLTAGFEQAGFDIKAAFDNWPPAIKVYRENFSHPIFEQDLADADSASQQVAHFQPDVIIGGPPCQDFSTAGRQDEARGRAALSFSFARIVSNVRPTWFVMENVANIKKSPTWDKMIEEFESAGYGLTCIQLNAAYCGVPQTRKRMFVIGGLNRADNFLSEQLRAGLSSKPMTIRDYLGSSLGIDHYFRVPTNYSRRGVFSIDEPSMTIRGVDRPIPPGYKGNSKDSAPVADVRPLTPVERSYIQTFPRDFKFVGGKSDVNQMIGNAVPVNLAKYVGVALHDFLINESIVDK